MQPDVAMVEAVRRARAGGMRTALVSNSWGVHRYPHDLFDELFDGVVISGEERMRKPSRRMYELGAERAGVAAELCVYVDDLPFNLDPAEELGMATVHHTSAEQTIPELERLLGLALGDGGHRRLSAVPVCPTPVDCRRAHIPRVARYPLGYLSGDSADRPGEADGRDRGARAFGPSLTARSSPACSRPGRRSRC